MSTTQKATFASTFGFEMRKMLAPMRIQGLLLLCLFVPAAFIGAINMQDHLPADTIFGRWIKQSGWSAMMTAFAISCLWVLPLLTSVVAGDSFAAEDRLGTWRHLVMAVRSPGRIFAAKVLAAYLLLQMMIVLLVISAVAGGLLFVGNHPLIGLTGQPIDAGGSLRIVGLVWLSMALGVLAFGAVGVLGSVLMGRSPMGLLLPALLSFGLQICQLLPLPAFMRVVLPSQSNVAWRGLTTSPTQYGPWFVGLGVSVVWTIVLTLVARHFFLRRDFTDVAYDGAPRRVMFAGLLPLLLLVGILALALAPFVKASGNGISQAKVERAVADTFANLYVLQTKQLNRPPLTFEEVAATSTCDRGGPTVEDEGPGADWRCVVEYRNPGSTTTGQAIYQVEVAPDGRIVADGDGPIPVNGYFTVETPTGPAANPMWQFDSLVDLLSAK